VSSVQTGPPATTRSGSTWATRNTLFLCMSLVAFLGAILVFIFGVAFTNGVYGSRIAWLLGVSIPLLAIASVLATGTFRRVGKLEGRDESVGKSNQIGGGVKVSKTIAGISVTLIAIPFALAAMLLCVYGLFIVIHWLSH
jgi:hypothetical protein